MKKVLSLIAAVLLLFGLFHATAETARIAPEPVDFDALAEVIDEYGEYTDRDSVAAYLRPHTCARCAACREFPMWPASWLPRPARDQNSAMGMSMSCPYCRSSAVQLP